MQDHSPAKSTAEWPDLERTEATAARELLGGLGGALESFIREPTTEQQLATIMHGSWPRQYQPLSGFATAIFAALQRPMDSTENS